ncbi:metalloregulator ArsR/SmtB family transcription factor [Amphritea pacifica]|uniref:Metalloregulator ArsR/SmtB family transcription factor n=1 Tax=Amphritea pacifica TaxID=2811233 RepID=A0ABS2W6H5_9GAMM|nr:metalloregulator ArsR/SmtB family transcription factor [Amphritea pacifica]MBN0987305.1 metalloregulator ArsR/SmtB family transcription factor [Amphritea pacifica]MBN1005795.1 metalloregulator ArsR/SmtB family transcription factor [Amphritea pacifica]
MHPVDLFKCLADETRLKSVLLIKQYKELCVCELIAALELSQPKVSRHLAQLKKAGVLSDRRHGQWVFYRINPDLPGWCRNILWETLVTNPDYIAEEKLRLTQMGERPDRNRTFC